MTIAEISRKYLNQPNPQTGRGYWTAEEIAAAEKMNPVLVGEMIRFAQTFTKDKPVDLAAIQAAWDKAQAAKAVPKPPVVQASSQPRKIGDVPEDDYWTKLRALLDR